MDLFELVGTLNLDATSFTGALTSTLKSALELCEQFARDTLTTGMGFEEQMSAVRAVMGLTEDTEENMAKMTRMRDYALEQARDSIFTAEETAQAYYYMGMAGWDDVQAVAGLAGIMDLAAASGESLKLTSDMVTDSLTAFGLGAGQASHFADVLAVTATNANTDVARMQKTFQYVAPIAGALGYTLEDVALSVGLVADSGIKGSQAGTTLRNIFTRIATNAGSTAKDLGALEIVTDKLGVSFYTAEGRARPWGEVLTDMRAAWNKLDPNQADDVAAAFGEFALESQSADEIMAEFATDLDEWTTIWNGLTTAAERESFAAELEPQFAALGISMRDSNGQLREFNIVAQDARVKLGGLSDQEQIYYGKQIGSLRGISGFLALMKASDKDVNDLAEALANADGAAKAMADTRLDNLAGDVKLINSSLDVLQNTLYEDVKAPLREAAQYAADAIDRITDSAKTGGITGFVQQVGTEIRAFSDEYSDDIEQLVSSLVPLLATIFNAIAPAMAEAAIQLGIAIGKGIVQGIMNEIQSGGLSGNPILTALFPGLGSFGASRTFTDALLGRNTTQTPTVSETLASDRSNSGEFLASIGADTTDLQNAIDEALESESNVVYIKGYQMSTDAAQALLDSLSSVGTDAGKNVSADIQSELNSTNFSVNVTGYVQTVFGGASTGWTAERHARSMFGGSILRGATVFGMNSEGRPMVGGGEGPEAVVGTGSLDQMIRASVNGAMGHVLSRLDTMVSHVTSYSPKFYLDTGALVGGTVNGMNAELNNVAVWKGFGRA